MNQQAFYESQIRVACTQGLMLDPLYVMGAARQAMFSNAAKKYGATGHFKRSYHDAKDRVMKRAYLPDRTPRTALEAGLMVLERAQVL